MSDIVERLRKLEQWIRNPEGENFTLASDIFDEAADEIERLRVRETRLQKALQDIIEMYGENLPAGEIALAALGDEKK